MKDLNFVKLWDLKAGWVLPVLLIFCLGFFMLIYLLLRNFEFLGWVIRMIVILRYYYSLVVHYVSLLLFLLNYKSSFGFTQSLSGSNFCILCLFGSSNRFWEGTIVLWVFIVET